ncbi:MAG: TIR domain-containing protein [Chryseobacterium sp.]|jgi:hypothetical protein|uniref:toll/interleukin-1 receptor domain-containing protein n=1 Tax=Chryseobacterium sp. TaxID=1871047 RepID=UPI0028248EB4|nr:TIR domain-containing protein [Chryseobacterium sp.]MDR2234695.1 TIR domain-containing protein [Chryseobacterium sp.]
MYNISFLNRAKKTILGYDIFISYSRKDSLDYAYTIAQYFMKKGFECYIDQLSSITPGKKLPANIKDAVKRSTAFVLIGSEGATNSEAIEQEIKLFLKYNKNKPLIPITIDGAINSNVRWYSEIEGLALIDDSSENIKNSSPAIDVLDRIENALHFTKKSVRLRSVSLAVILGILIISGFATYFVSDKATEAKLAIIEKKQADSLRDIAFKQLTRTNELRNIALKDRKEAIHQKQKADKLKIQADSLKNLAVIGKIKAEKLRNTAESLKLLAEKRVNHLNQQSEMLGNRISAMSNLESDPIKAYRFAEETYKFEKSTENRELIFATLSSIDYYYTSVLNNYHITDFKEPYILLIDDSKDRSNLAVYDMRTSKLKITSITTDQIGWIIPMAYNSYKILTRNWQGEGLNAIPVYQLWNDASISISDKILGGGMTLPNFINEHKVSIKLLHQPKTLIWDLLSDQKKYISEDTSDQFSGYFREIYGTLDIRKDGTAAAHHDNGLVLVSNDGAIDITSYTKVDFDPSSFYSKAQWSSDDDYLALNYFKVKGLGLWDPKAKLFNWIGSPNGTPFDLSKPNNWIVNAWSWSQKGHLLAFSGRTENDVDITVEVIDGGSFEKTRKIIYRGEIPIQSISFLPGDKKIVICDKERNMSIIDIETRKVVGKGQKTDEVKSSSLGFYSSTIKDFKSWQTLPAPSKNWFFQSDSTKTYLSQGAVDPLNKYMAVPYSRKNDITSGVELRNILTGEKKFLKFAGHSVHNVEFSTNGNWLVLETSDKINIWNTKTWIHSQFPLILGDQQFIDLEVKSDTLYAKIIGASAKYEIEYLFDLRNANPKFIERTTTNKKTINKHQSKKDKIEELVNGWKMDKLYKYQSVGWKKSGKWAVRLTCRDKAFGASDCDVQFIPTDIEWLMKLYDGLLWKPTKKELVKSIHNN